MSRYFVIVRTVLIKLCKHLNKNCRAQGLSESRDGRLGLPVPNKPYGLCARTEATLKQKL